MVGPKNDLGNTVTYNAPKHAAPLNGQDQSCRKASERVARCDVPNIYAAPNSAIVVVARLGRDRRPTGEADSEEEPQAHGVEATA